MFVQVCLCSFSTNLHRPLCLLRSLCCGYVGGNVFADSTDGEGAKPENLESLLSGGAFSFTSLSAYPEFHACSAEEECAECLEIAASTQCIRRDVAVVKPSNCDDAKEVICCVFENDQGCMKNYLLRVAIGKFSFFSPTDELAWPTYVAHDLTA